MKKIITSIDCGSSEIKLIVGEIFNRNLNVLAVSSIKSQGIKKGVVVDEEKATQCIKEAFKRCEETLGISLNKTLLVVPAHKCDYINANGQVEITRENNVITDKDILKLYQNTLNGKIKSSMEFVSITPKNFILDGKRNVKRPLGEKASKIELNACISLVPKEIIVGLLNIFDKLKIDVCDICFSSQADYYNIKEEDLKQNIAVVNIGHEKTEISYFENDTIKDTIILSFGTNQIDKDISYNYNISLEEAKKLKEQFSSCTVNENNKETYELLTNDETHITISLVEISQIVAFRVEEMLNLIKKEINILTKKENSYIIISGGVTCIDGFDLISNKIFKDNLIIYKVNQLGCRNNKYSSSLGFIKYYEEKLSVRGKEASTVDENSQEDISDVKKKISSVGLFGKLYEYFFDN